MEAHGGRQRGGCDTDAAPAAWKAWRQPWRAFQCPHELHLLEQGAETEQELQVAAMLVRRNLNSLEVAVSATNVRAVGEQWCLEEVDGCWEHLSGSYDCMHFILLRLVVMLLPHLGVARCAAEGRDANTGT